MTPAGFDIRPLLPAAALVVAGVAVLLAQAFAGRARRIVPTGLALGGIVAAGIISLVVPFGEPCGTCAIASQNAVAFDALARFLTLLILATGALTILSTHSYAARSGTAGGEHHALLLFALTGMLGMVSAVDLIALFIALEVMSVALYALTGLRRGVAASSEAALKYFVTGAFSSAFLLYGIALLYGATGTTSLVHVEAVLASPLTQSPLLLAAVALLLVGFGFKVASVPFHMWAPDVYEGAPTTVTGFMAAAVKAAAFGAILRLFPGALAALGEHWRPAVAVLAILTMVWGNLGALAQTRLKRLLAYSSIAHAGYLLVGLVGSPQDAVASIGFYLAGYAAVTVGAFGAISALDRDVQGPVTLEHITGLAARRPGLAALLAIYMISLTGIPLTAGFVGKLMLFRAAVLAHWTVLAVVGVLASAVSAYYYLRVVVVMYMREESSAPEGVTLDIPSWATLVLSAGAVLWLGIFPAHVLAWARAASAVLK
jgi:NADH-quinone oxidoreductase subunit N